VPVDRVQFIGLGTDWFTSIDKSGWSGCNLYDLIVTGVKSKLVVLSLDTVSGPSVSSHPGSAFLP
jgi:hypothetical protein